jgi:hypothetical protein
MAQERKMTKEEIREPIRLAKIVHRAGYKTITIMIFQKGTYANI